MKNKVKNIFCSLLLASSAIFVSGCSMFQANNVEANRLVVKEANFVSSYSSITFNFEKDENAKSYSVFFSVDGVNRNSLTEVEPQTNYSLSFLPDGSYKVSIRAKAKSGFIDSEMFPMGEITKKKTVKNENDIELAVTTTTDYGITVQVSNKNKNDLTPITSIVYYGLIEIGKEEGIIGSSTFSTSSNLSAGEYKVVAFFEETETSSASDELIFDGKVTIPKREIFISDLNVFVEDEKVKLDWEQSSSSANKILKITNSKGTIEYTNVAAGTSIRPGMIIDDSLLAEGDNTFELKLKPSQSDATFLESNTITNSLNIQVDHPETPLVSSIYNDDIGLLTVNCPNATKNAKYSLKIEEKNPNAHITDSTPPIAINEVVTSFPFEVKGANFYKHCSYKISVKKIGTSIFSPESSTTTNEVDVTAINMTPEVTFKKEEPISPSALLKFGESLVASWSSPEFANYFDGVTFSYEVFLKNLSLKTIEKKTLTISSSTASGSLKFPVSFLPKDKYKIIVSFSQSTKTALGNSYGFNFGSEESSFYECGERNFSTNELFPSKVNYKWQSSGNDKELILPITFGFAYVSIVDSETEVTINYTDNTSQKIELADCTISGTTLSGNAPGKNQNIKIPFAKLSKEKTVSSVSLKLVAKFAEEKYSKYYSLITFSTNAK